jgi:hypothetical protein
VNADVVTKPKTPRLHNVFGSLIERMAIKSVWMTGDPAVLVREQRRD